MRQLGSSLVISAAFGLALACSAEHGTELGSGGLSAAGAGNASASGASPSSNGGTLGDDSIALPEGLPNTLQDGEVGVALTLIAFTLTQGDHGPELYTAVRNDGHTPACEAGITTYFIDKADRLVATVGSVLQTAQFYQLDTGKIIRCLDPGQIAMSGSTELPANIELSELAALKHAFPAFTIDGIVPVAALTVDAVQVVNTAAGSAYAGTLSNHLTLPATQPSIAIFPLNRAGRPLGMATASDATELLPAGTWQFQTSTVRDSGVDYAAFPSFSD
jgi:hypothetical protein